MASTMASILGLILLSCPVCIAVHKGYKPTSISEVPYAAGFLFRMDEAESDAYTTCDTELLSTFCSGGMISEGVFLTAAHCFETKAAAASAAECAKDPNCKAASDGTLDLSKIRVGLGARYPYRNDDGTCSGSLRGTSSQIYKVKAVYIHKAFKVMMEAYDYNNPKTGQNGIEGTNQMDHMDVAVVYLDECTTPVSGSNKPRHGKIAGGKFKELAQMWANFGSKTNTGGLPGSYWGYGESEDDTVTTLPKSVRRGNWNFLRGTSPPTVTGGKVWNNCDWLPDDTPLWNSSSDTVLSAYQSSTLKASPFVACHLRAPNDASVKSRCQDQVTSATCLEKKSASKKSFCKWASNACSIDEGVAGGIGMVTYPSSGGGDSGSAAWYIENSNKLTLQDRDQLKLVHIGIVYAATTFFPGWDQVIRTDYFQNWLANVVDRDTCAQRPTKDYFSGFDDTIVNAPYTARSPPITQSGWDLNTHYVGQVKGLSGYGGLSRMAKRANAGDWTVPGPSPTTTAGITTTIQTSTTTPTTSMAGTTTATTTTQASSTSGWFHDDFDEDEGDEGHDVDEGDEGHDIEDEDYGEEEALLELQDKGDEGDDEDDEDDGDDEKGEMRKTMKMMEMRETRREMMMETMKVNKYDEDYEDEGDEEGDDDEDDDDVDDIEALLELEGDMW